MEIIVPPIQTPPSIASQNSSPNTPIPPIPDRHPKHFKASSSVERPIHHTDINPTSSTPLRNSQLEKVAKDITSPPLPRLSIPQSTSAPSRESICKTKQLTGLDLGPQGVTSVVDQDYSPVDSNWSTDSSSMYSQPGMDYDRWEGYVGPSSYHNQQSLRPQPATAANPSHNHHTQLYMRKQDPRALRHPEVSKKDKAKLRIENRVQQWDPSIQEQLRNLIYQEGQQDFQNRSIGHGQEKQQQSAQPAPHYEPEDTRLASLVPKPLSIRPKPNAKPSLTSKQSSFIRTAKESLSYGINELTSPSSKSSFSASESQVMSRNPTYPIDIVPVSPMGYMESDHLILPPLLIPSLPDTPSASPSPKSRFQHTGTDTQPLKITNPFKLNTSEEPDTISSPSEYPQKHLPRNMKSWSGAESRKPDGPGTPVVVSSKPSFGGLLPSPKILQKGNERFKEVVGKAKKSVRAESAEEEKRRRESLKGKIVVVGITDQSPGELSRGRW